MNVKQKESLAKYLYDLSKAIHIGWIIGLAADRISWMATVILAIVGADMLLTAYKMEAKDD